MPHNFAPQVGDWYRLPDGSTFEIVATDSDEGTIDLQYFGGEIEGVDSESWELMDLVPIDAPEDWSGPYDDLVSDDFGDIDQAQHPEMWGGYLEALDRFE